MVVRLLALGAAAALCLAQEIGSSTFAGLKLRSVGPAVASGRVTSLAVDPRNRNRYFVGVASGGVWKTENNGGSWTPVFESEGSYSIGVVTLDPNNPNTVWIGTGENNSQRSVGYGDGVYRSDDGGKSWRNTGLKYSEHIGRIAVDPRDSNVVYVAAQGPLWGPGGDRGLYKTTDGGKYWKKVLEISENTGVADVAMDPANPSVLLAAAWQRRRHVWTLINGGPESALYKSTDAGATWRKVTSGLPKEELGRIGLAMSPAKPGMVYARVEAANGGNAIYRSHDSGESWEKGAAFAGLPMYYGQIVADPRNADRLYVMDTYTQVSDDGGKILRRHGDRAKHIDTHTYWIDPKDNQFILAGCDGGVYESHDGGKIWIFKGNLPTVQFYNVTVDNSKPFYFIYGGTQDNFTWGGPSRTRNASGIVNSDWFVTVGGDGFVARVDPADPNTVYGEFQYGGLARYDRRTGERIGIKPIEGKGEPPFRWNWESPFILSPHSSKRLYFAANKLFRSDDRGDSWRAVSGDLTRQVDRDSLPVMGRVWGADAVAKNQSTSLYSNITALAESPRQEGLLYAGTDDGLIQVSENGGAAWTKREEFTAVPKNTYVQRLLASQHEAQVVYAAFDNHKNSDFAPYLLKSADRGATWTPIAGDLPKNGPVLAIAEDHVNRDLLFAGTEFGLFFTVDGGKKWFALKGGMPTIAVRDLAIQQRENDLVLATFGRGFYVFDDYSPLRHANAETLAKEAVLFPVKDALMYIESQPIGGRGKSFQGEAYFTAPNPPLGAVFTYYLKQELLTKKKARQEAEKKAVEKKESAPYPTPAQLSAEAKEEPPVILLTVTDESGRVVKRLTGPVGKGFQRVNWSLRAPPSSLAAPSGDEEDDASDSGGFLVPPGAYQVSASTRVDGVTRAFGEPRKFRVVAEAGAHPARWEFQQKLTRIQSALEAALESANQTRQRLAAVRKALSQSAAPDRLFDETSMLDKRVTEILEALRGDRELARRNQNTPPAIADRIGAIAYEQRLSTSAPTQTHRQSFQIASDELAEQSARLVKLVNEDLKKLEQALDAAGVPHTPGRLPVWRK